MSLAQRLHDRRIQRRLTNGQVAAYMGISKTHISEMEKGRSNPSLDLLSRLATYYHTTTDWLLGQTDNPAPLQKPIYCTLEADQVAHLVDAMSQKNRTLMLELARTLAGK